MLRRYRLVIGAMQIVAIALVGLATFYITLVKGSGIGEAAAGAAQTEPHESHLSINFSGYTGGSVEKWLTMRGFTFEKDAKKRKLLELSITDESLQLIGNGHLTGFILNDSVKLSKPGRIRINWGVRRYPQEASYEKQVNNEALMVYIFFGKEKVPSGTILIPNSPYFIGLFLCQEEQVNFPYKGRYFHAGGRFVCLGKPPAGETVVSEFDLDRAFRNYFGKRQTPGISGIAFGVDTSKALGDGKSVAFIKTIELFGDSKM